MSDLIGNHGDEFSCDRAYSMNLLKLNMHTMTLNNIFSWIILWFFLSDIDNQLTITVSKEWKCEVDRLLARGTT